MQGYVIRVRGQVQGVGFRPFVWQLARRMDLRGEVLNDPEGVLIRVLCNDASAFVEALRAEAPPLARVDAIETQAWSSPVSTSDFAIVASEGQGAETRVTPDAATCAACTADVLGDDPRRAGYAFTNCTHCGPRFTILKGLPYDRARTSMARFEMCADCAAEYEHPGDRRFHAQPVACHVCGPRLWLESNGEEIAGDAISEAAGRLKLGQILAIKGLGGFHLACDATSEAAVKLLRARKRRPGKPLALMDLPERIARYAETTSEENMLLSDPAAPIVLLKKRAGALPDILAPGIDRLGVMLPYTPLHHLLLRRMAGPLVMTSGNLSGEPQVIANEEAREKLGHISDGFLMHDRDIMRRLDDSVEQITPEGPMVLRRARGRVPETLPLPPGFEDAPQTIAFGAHLKSSICLLKNGQALLSHHLGDLDDALTREEFLKADADYSDLFDHAPTLVACDLHPGYASSQHAQDRAAPHRPFEVQHHHAHLAACMAENEWPLAGGKVAGIILDGLGLGPDNTIWGGELLVGDYTGFERHAWLHPVPLVGGDAAQREPWRNAVMRLDATGCEQVSDELFGQQPIDLIRQAARACMNAPPTSSAGRLFDGFAALLGLAAEAQSFEGEAAMRLEALARSTPRQDNATSYLFGLDQLSGALDDGTLWQAACRDRLQKTAPAVMARRFHQGVAQSFARQARRLVDEGQARAVALSGGCFQNALLLEETVHALRGVPVLLHHKVPANDGGLALGQAVIAAASTLFPAETN